MIGVVARKRPRSLLTTTSELPLRIGPGLQKSGFLCILVYSHGGSFFVSPQPAPPVLEEYVYRGIFGASSLDWTWLTKICILMYLGPQTWWEFSLRLSRPLQVWRNMYSEAYEIMKQTSLVECLFHNVSFFSGLDRAYKNRYFNVSWSTDMVGVFIAPQPAPPALEEYV